MLAVISEQEAQRFFLLPLVKNLKQNSMFCVLGSMKFKVKMMRFHISMIFYSKILCPVHDENFMFSAKFTMNNSTHILTILPSDCMTIYGR